MPKRDTAGEEAVEDGVKEKAALVLLTAGVCSSSSSLISGS